MRLSGLGSTEPQVFSLLRLRLLTCTASRRPDQGFDRVELSLRERHGPGQQVGIESLLRHEPLDDRCDQRVDTRPGDG